MSETITRSNINGQIATLTLDMPDKGANVLSSHVLNELEQHLDRLRGENELKGLIILSGKPGTFVAGADLREFVASLDADRTEIVNLCRRGRLLFARLHELPFVTVAAIDGICVGGGAELAIACDRRIVTDALSTQFGFPEVKLGLFPGWGGTVRTPRIVGLYNAVEMITSGESVDAADAVKMGLATESVPAERLLDAAIHMIEQEAKSRSFLQDRAQWAQPIEMSETELGFLGVTAAGFIEGQTKGHYPAPLAALEVLIGGSSLNPQDAGELESEEMANLFGSPVNRALLNVFFLTDRNKKQIATHQSSNSIENVGVVGAGIMGQGIAAANLRRQVPTMINDAAADVMQRGMQSALEQASYSRKLKGPDVEQTLALAPLLNPALEVAEMRHCDLVIEAAVERPDVKKIIFSNLEAVVEPTAVLATNTSTIPIDELASTLSHPERFLGIHFFNPVRKMPLVEIIRGTKTSDAAISTAFAYAKKIKKSPILVRSGPGFLVNRLLLPYMSEAVELLLEGVEPRTVDRVATQFGMPMGPIELYDVVGLDVAAYAGKTMFAAFPDRVLQSPLVEDLVEAGRLGQKTEHGFYSYRNKKRRAESDTTLIPFIDKHKKEARQLNAEEIQDRLLLPMLLEATRVLDENIVENPRDVDLGLILGIGFPPFRGGLLFWADTLGTAEILKKLDSYRQLGSRYEPTDRLIKLAEAGKAFYD
ncbi:MAG: 3-hydroxyacyl-CoA dehydrogenase NAD-binding domain-containing protein [Planctomycetota bacterium]|nr:3-hydroxyacyl-CoA dehydrogenase NAD-binding domain-containing protein [Planctomycetota bacterium]